MAGELSGSAILEAVKHRANHKPIIFCSLGLVAVGILMTIFGVIALLLDHAELGPPVYDSHYERYAGSSLAHILGPLFIAFGSLTILGNLCMLAYASRAYYLREQRLRRQQVQTSVKGRQTNRHQHLQQQQQQQAIALI